ncbi:MAG: rhomboid family intramembrane serine protease [Bacteroidales bacterium]|jgi:membrane associated rhomboid family serine protease|nr:rhomboid family intramembrane serine protease [Bacteroidales bacterium]
MNNYQNPFGFKGNNYGNQSPPSPFDGIKRFFGSKTILSRLIIINVAVFIVIGLIRLTLKLFLISPATGIDNITFFTYWLGVHSNTVFLLKMPWTILTYMFLHENLWHIFFNMLMLYFGGIIFTEYLSGKKLLLTYLLGGLTGAVFYIVSYNIFPVFAEYKANSVALGASASVMAIIIAIATYIPNYTVRLFFTIRIKFKWVAIIFVILDLLSIEQGNPGGHIAHLGGAFFGFVYIFSLKKGLIARKLFNPIRKLFSRKPKTKTSFTNKPKTDDQYRYERKVHEQRIDAILDKIKQSGYESLSKEDKEYLFKASKNK